MMQSVHNPEPVAGWFGRRSLVCLRDCYMVVCEGCACVTCSDDIAFVIVIELLM